MLLHNRTNRLWFMILSVSILILTDQVTAVERKTLSLKEAVQMGIEYYPELKTYEAQANIARQEVNISRTNFLPKLSANTFLTKADMPMNFNSWSGVMPTVTSMVPDGSHWQQNFTVMVPLFTGGMNYAQLQKTKSELKMSTEEWQAQKLELSLNIKTFYRTAVYYESLISTYQEMLKTAEEQYKNDKVAVEIGKLAQVYLLRDETRVAQSRQMLTDATKEYQIDLLQLKSLLGIPTETELQLDRIPDAVEAIQWTQNSALELSVKNRPDLFAMENSLHAQKWDKKVVESELSPQIGLMGMKDFFKKDAEGNKDDYTYGLVVSFPFFGSGETFYKIRQSQQRIKSADYTYQTERIKLKLEIESLYLSLTAAEQSIETSKTSIVSAQENYRIMKLAFESGKKTQLEFLDSVAMLYQSKTNLQKSILEYQLNIDKLERLVGLDAYL
jgi:outer membrane protein TolC